MSVVFEAGRVRRPAFFVFRRYNRHRIQFLGIVTARHEEEAKAEATLTWGAEQGPYIALEWWRGALVLEQHLAIELEVVKRMSHPPDTKPKRGRRLRA